MVYLLGSGVGQRRHSDEAANQTIVSEERGDFAAQFIIARAGLVEERLALARLPFKRGVVELLDLFPLLRRHHDPFRQARAGATSWPVASRA